MKHHYALLLSALAATSTTAAPTTYNVDPDHTHPSFEMVLRIQVEGIKAN